jgi:putative transposase
MVWNRWPEWPEYAISKLMQYLKGVSSRKMQMEFKELKQRYWGKHIWARGYFCATTGSISEDQIKKYIENHVEEDEHFTISNS